MLRSSSPKRHKLTPTVETLEDIISLSALSLRTGNIKETNVAVVVEVAKGNYNQQIAQVSQLNAANTGVVV